MSKLRFRADLHVEVVPPDMVFLLSEYHHYTLQGHLYTLLAPLLTGDYSDDEIVNALVEHAPSAQINYALHRLRRAGYVRDIGDADATSSDQARDAYFEIQGGTGSQPTAPRIALHAFGIANPEAMLTDLCTHLEAMGAQITTKDPSFQIGVTHDFLDPALSQFNQKMLTAKTPWLLVKPVGATVWIGPIFQPGETACWECLAQRLRRNRRVESFVQHKLELLEPITLSRAALHSTIQTALSMAATEAIRWSTLGYSALAGKIFVLDTVSLDLQQHTVMRRPQCPACGNPISAPPEPIVLQRRPKVSDIDSGYRTERAQETFERYKHHVSPITGAVTALEPRFSNELIHVYASGDNTSRPLSHWEHMRRSLRSLNGGKGMNDTQAKVSALCEALERYSGQYEGNERRTERLYQSSNEEMIHPEQLLLFSDRQYREREQLNEINPPNNFIPQRFDPDRPIDWSPVWSLTEKRHVLIPTAYCYYGYPLPKDHLFCGADSNGSAAGSSLEDAILQGFLELVERDAVAIWWYNRIKRPAVMFDQPYLQKIREYYATINREIWLLNLTTDFNIPVCAAVSRRVDKPAEDILMGFGAHLDFRIAALRAVTELNQMLGPVLNVGLDESKGYTSGMPWEITWWRNATIASEPYLTPEASLPPIPISEYPAMQYTDVRDDVRFCLELARQLQLNVLVLDQTRPDVGLPVVKVIVPGMRHFWGRFARGRLYDVPVKLGWLSEPTPEALLNPNPMTL